MVDLRKYITYLQPQENIGCCTACATLTAIEIICNKANSRLYFSRLFVYYMARKMAGRIGQNGVELGTTLESVQKFGVCLNSTWKFSHNLVNREPSAQAQTEAMSYRVRDFGWVEPYNFNMYLEKEIPIIIGLRTGKLFWKLKGALSEQTYKIINSIDNRQAQGHAVTIVGFDNNLHGGSWIIANSLGPGWGDKGYSILPYECASDIGEAYVVRDFYGISAERKI